MSCAPQSLPSKKSEMWRRSGHRLARHRRAICSFLVLHEPMDVQLHCVIKKKSSVEEEKIVFLYKHLRLSTRSISQGTDVTIVTEYAFCVWYNSCVFIRHLKKISINSVQILKIFVSNFDFHVENNSDGPQDQVFREQSTINNAIDAFEQALLSQRMNF